MYSCIFSAIFEVVLARTTVPVSGIASFLTFLWLECINKPLNDSSYKYVLDAFTTGEFPGV